MTSDIDRIKANKPNEVLGRTVWSSPQMDDRRGRRSACRSCKFFADSGTKVSKLAREIAADMTFGWCQNVRIWAAFGKEKPPLTRSYHYCNFYKEKENETD